MNRRELDEQLSTAVFLVLTTEHHPYPMQTTAAVVNAVTPLCRGLMATITNLERLLAGSEEARGWRPVAGEKAVYLRPSGPVGAGTIVDIVAVYRDSVDFTFVGDPVVVRDSDFSRFAAVPVDTAEAA